MKQFLLLLALAAFALGVASCDTEFTSSTSSTTPTNPTTKDPQQIGDPTTTSDDPIPAGETCSILESQIGGKERLWRAVESNPSGLIGEEMWFFVENYGGCSLALSWKKKYGIQKKFGDLVALEYRVDGTALPILVEFTGAESLPEEFKTGGFVMAEKDGESVHIVFRPSPEVLAYDAYFEPLPGE